MEDILKERRILIKEARRLAPTGRWGFENMDDNSLREWIEKRKNLPPAGFTKLIKRGVKNAR